MVVALAVVVVSGCSGGQRSAAGASESAVTASSEPSASGSSASAGLLASGGVPDVPVPAQWREVAPHEVQWTVWTPRDALVTGVEAEVVNGASPAGPVGCVPSPSPSPDTRSYWTCSLFARQGQRTVRARALKTSGGRQRRALGRVLR